MKEDSLKKKLLFAAMKEFSEKGYLGASLADIASHCKTSSALVCYHFNTKDNLAKEVVDYLRMKVSIPKATDPATISDEGQYRAALKKFISDFIDLFMTSEEPMCYVSSLYRHESANPRAKSSSLHDALLLPIFRELEKLIAAGVSDGEPVTIRFWALAVWNILLGYTMKDSGRVRQYYPSGMSPGLFRQTAIDFVVDRVLAMLKFRSAIG